LPTVNELSDKGAKVLVLAHFGRPKGQKSAEFSLSEDARAVQAVLGREVMFAIPIARRCRSRGNAASAGRYRRA
jgi:phosphoglycerate kinase